jgi:hypothetical protein
VTHSESPALSLPVRASLVASLEADLIGPFSSSASGEELLPLPPSRWYLTGFLSPSAAREVEDPTEAEELPAGSELDDEEAAGAEPEPKQRHRFPASMGMSIPLWETGKVVDLPLTVSPAITILRGLIRGGAQAS